MTVNVIYKRPCDDIIEDLLDQSEIYLDISHWDQVDSIVDRAFEMENQSLLLIM